MDKPYKVVFSQSAKVVAQKRGLALPTLEAYIREQMRLYGYHGGDDADCYPPELIFHTVDYDQPQPWMIHGDAEESVLVEPGLYEETEMTFPEGHPFNGKKVFMPRSDDDA